jgi:MoxR-like ATPase
MAVQRADATFGSVDELQRAFLEEAYLIDRGLATTLFLALRMGRPVLLEGEPGVGKTELARTAARVLGSRLVRLQCYEGIDAGQAMYEWDYSRQLLHARIAADDDRSAGGDSRALELYSERFLLERPLLTAIRQGSSAVLLIDEIDRADDEFEAFLLEPLSDYAVTIPELGTVAALSPPLVVITSNRTRELHDALKRRCLFHWIDFPSREDLARIIRLRSPDVPARLAASVADAIERIRGFGLIRMPGSAEAIDWAEAITILGADAVTSEAARETLGLVIKNQDDMVQVAGRIPELVDGRAR